MLTSILTPVVHGNTGQHSSRQAWVKLVAWHALGSGVAAVSVGIILTLLGGALARRGLPIARWGTWAGVFLAVVYFPRQMAWTNWPPLIQSTRQVPRRWAYNYPRWLSALLFGLGLGSGLYTRVVVPTFYLLLVWPLLMPGSLLGAVVWLAYGLSRSCNVCWIASTAPLGDPLLHVGRMMSALMRSAEPMYRGNALLTLIILVWLLTW